MNKFIEKQIKDIERYIEENSDCLSVDEYRMLHQQLEGYIRAWAII